MKINKNIIILVVCSIAGSVSAAPKAQWATSFDNNKSANTLIKQVDSPKANISHDAVSFSYKLGVDEKLNFDSSPFEEKSKQYWIDSTSNKLAKGIQLPVTGGDAIIRISPLTNDKSVQLTANMIKIQNNGLEKSIQVFADSNDLKAAGTNFSDNSIALKLNAQAGQLNLKLDGLTADMPFVIHVLEPNSTHVLTLSSQKNNYNANQTISINSNMKSSNLSIATALQGYISRPDGSVLGELNFSQNQNGSYKADINALGAQGMAQGLWEVHVFSKSMENGIEILRDAQTSFSVNLNTAEFNGNLTMIKSQVQVGVNVGLAGRYEVRGVLMGTDKATNELKPIAMTMSANWLKSGAQSISLPIDAQLMAESKLSAPFTIMNVKLTNQTYMAPVQTVQEGIQIENFSIDEKLSLK